uniref:CCHC-type domain-containing protein n=1 Tax=Caenorhabditis japonica TaxID=281687 RepID=A0A8R1IKU5_CAEJA
ERGPFIGRVESAATTSMATNESVDFGSDTRRFKRQAESREDEPERLHAKMPVRCYACQRQGHYASECPQLRRFAEPGSAGADVRRKASLLGQNLPSTAKAYLSECNRRWLWSDGKRMLVGGTGEQRFLLFLAERSLEVGSSALAKAVAAFQLSNSTLSPFAAQLSSDIIKSRKKSEIFHRTQPKKVSEDVVLKIIESVTDERKSEKDTLLVAILWYVLLRAEEAANLQWQDIGGHRGTFKVTVRQAKNDQLALGRSTFVECKEGSLLMNPIKSKYVFPNLTNGAKLSARAVAEISKEKLASVGMVATHHALRRGAANHLQEKGLTFEQIKARGR